MRWLKHPNVSVTTYSSPGYTITGKSTGNDPGWHWAVSFSGGVISADNVQDYQILWLYYQLDTLRCLYGSSELEFFLLQFNLRDTRSARCSRQLLNFIKLNFTLRGHTCRALKRSHSMACSNLTFINSHCRRYGRNCCLKCVWKC